MKDLVNKIIIEIDSITDDVVKTTLAGKILNSIAVYHGSGDGVKRLVMNDLEKLLEAYESH